MSCKKTKCKTPECTTVLKACKLVNGKCPACHAKEVAAAKKQNP